MSSSQPMVGVPGRVFLEKIVAQTHSRIAHLRSERSMDSLLAEAKRFERRPLHSALTCGTPAIIAEIKKASPSKGLLRADFDPVRLASAYQLGGAAALSIVTEPEYFQGTDAWISAVRARTNLPILRKDFVLEPLQVAEAAAIGADAILLIARLLSVSWMQELHDAAHESGLDVLFEAHDETDLDKIAQCEPRLVGVNSRNLDTFVVDTSQFAQLKSMIPQGTVAIAESGIDSRGQILSVMELGYSGFLIGKSLVTSSDPVAMLRTLRTGAAS